MYNLPSDASINDMIIYHEGNHTDKGNPHNNYISKYSCNYTVNVKNNINKYTKIATISYEPNTNVEFLYEIELFSTKFTSENKIILTCGYDIKKIYCKFIGNNNINIVLKTRTKNSKNIIDIYIQIKQTWIKLYYRLYFARCLDYLTLYDEEYAYKCISFFNEQLLIDNIESDISIVYDRPIKYVSVKSNVVNILANNSFEVILNISNLNIDSYLINCIPVGLSKNLIYSNIHIKEKGKLAIIISNLSNININLPEIQWNIVYK